MTHRRGRERLDLICAMCPSGEIVVDVGADHGHVAHRIGAIATERQPDRRGRPDVPWIIADGLRPFRRVDVAIIAGMGAKTIIGILEAGPRPKHLVLHTPDDVTRLRRYLADRGWRIETERLAREAGRTTVVLHATDGTETATDLELDHGPRLLEDGDPLLGQHLDELVQHWTDIARKTEGHAPLRHAEALRRAKFLKAQRERHS